MNAPKAHAQSLQRGQLASLSREWTVFRNFEDAEKADRQRFHSLSPRQRLEILELLRQMNHAGYDPHTERVQRVYTVTKRPTR